MPRTYIKRGTGRLNYDRTKLSEAATIVNNGRNLSAVAKEYGIPRNTLRNHLNGAKSVGGKPIFTKQQESILEERIIYLANRGFPISIHSFCIMACEYAKKLNRRGLLNSTYPNSWNICGKASLDWWFAFKKRHIGIALRIPEGLSNSRAQAFNRTRVLDYFAQLEIIFNELGIKDYPQLIYNCDETGLSTVPPKSKKVLAGKGCKTVQKFQAGERGALTTFLACGNANGNMIPPFIILKGSNVPTEIRNTFDSTMFVTGTKSGYIDTEKFILFLHHFDKHRERVHDKKCILVIDGHSSHMSEEAIYFCITHGIELVCIPPHTSHRLQPFDTNFFGPLKTIWSEAVSDFLYTSFQTIVDKMAFARIFRNVWERISQKRHLLIDGFKHCGLYPLKNTVEDWEYSKSAAFSDSTFNAGVATSDAIALHSVAPSPRKLASDAHQRPHIVKVSSSRFAKKVLIFAQSNLSAKVPSQRCNNSRCNILASTVL